MTRLKALSVFSFGLFLSGCNNQVASFIKNAEIKAPPIISTTPVSGDGAIMVKITPGQVSATAANGALVGSITSTERSFSAGADMSMTLTMSRERGTFTTDLQ